MQGGGEVQVCFSSLDFWNLTEMVNLSHTDILPKFANEWGIVTPSTILCIVTIKLNEKIVPFYVPSPKKKNQAL